MKNNISIGISQKKIKKVEEKDSAKNYGSGLVDVFSTPAMIAFMEQTCNELLMEYLQDTETSVGIEVCVRHLKATPIGDTITCNATITEISKNKITFHVEAFDSKGKIGEGTHKRAVVNKKEFLNNINN